MLFDMPFVYVIQGFDQGVREDIEGGVFRIGRDSSNQLQLDRSFQTPCRDSAG